MDDEKNPRDIKDMVEEISPRNEDDKKKTMSKTAKIIIACLALVVVALVGYIIVDKMSGNAPSGKQNGENVTATTRAATEEAKMAKATEKQPEENTGDIGATTEKATEKATEKTTEKVTEAATEKEDSSGGESVTRPAVYANVSAGNSWQSGDGYVVQYNADVYNKKDSAIKGWEVRIPGFANAGIGEHWSSEIELEGDTLVASAVDYNTSIEGGGTTNFGFQVTFKDEAAAKKIDVKAAEVYINGKACTDTVEVPTSANVEKKRVVEPEEGTALETHGALSVKGTDLVDQSGKLYQLKGVSTHGIAWFPQYVNLEAFRTFRDKWNANLIRLAMYTGEGGGYCSDGNKEELKGLVEKGVDYASQLGMYVIIDWHILSDNNPKTNQDEAVLFFDEMSKKYADYPNVIYEICNEPNGSTSWEEIKEYANTVIPVIRKNSPDSVIIVGTPTWSQDVNKAAADPLEFDNVMYTLHFYAATHKDDLRNKLTKAREAGLPIFISEFSICDASGNGGIDYDSANAWFQLIEDYGLSYAGWNISNKNESSAFIQPGCEKTSDWTDSELSETGLWLKNTMSD